MYLEIGRTEKLLTAALIRADVSFGCLLINSWRQDGVNPVGIADNFQVLFRISKVDNILLTLLAHRLGQVKVLRTNVTNDSWANFGRVGTSGPLATVRFEHQMDTTLMSFQFILRSERLSTALKGTDILRLLMAMINVIVHLLTVGGLKVTAIMGTLEVAFIVHNPHVHVQQFVLFEFIGTFGALPFGDTGVTLTNMSAQ